MRLVHRRWVYRMFWASTLSLAIAVVAVLGLWWRLSQGPIELDLATPWLKAAIQENFGGNRTVAVGGTQLERDEKGRTSVRLRDIVVRDADGTVVAKAPKAEVGLSAMALLGGDLRAESLNLVGAEMAVRIETDGRVTVFAGANNRPIATASPKLAPAQAGPAAGATAPANAAKEPLRPGLEDLAGLLGWIDGLGATGLDGHDLRELGLRNGNLTVDDRRNGKQWTFDHINASLGRPPQGGVVFRLESDNASRPWALSAAMRPLGAGVRAVGIEARHVSVRDLLLAMRVDEGGIDADIPLSASIRAEIAADGTPNVLQGQLVAGSGSVTDNEGGKPIRIAVDGADLRFTWDARRRVLVVPFQLRCGGNQFTMRAVAQSPSTDDGVWTVNVTRSDAVIDPIILASPDKTGNQRFAFNRVNVRARLDTVNKRIDVEQGDLSRIDTRAAYNLGLAITGSLDYSISDPHLAFGIAGTRMPMSVLKRVWPVTVAVHVRDWVETHVSDGVVERVVVAGNAPMSTFDADGPPLPEDGLSIDVETSGTTVRTFESLPAIRDADLTVHVSGRRATVNLGRGTVPVAPGRKLNIANGLFEVPDTHLKPAPASVRFRIDGSVSSAAALLASGALRDGAALLSIDPDASRGTVAAQVAVNLPLQRVLPDDAVKYAITADLSSFAADNMMMGKKLEASALRVTATNDGYQVKGNVKIDGMPASIELARHRKDAAADLHLQAALDARARRRLGIDFGDAVTGALPVKIVTKVGGPAKDNPMSLDADLTPVKIDDLLPGWQKAAGKPAHATATVLSGEKSVRFDDLAVDGSGATVKGAIEVANSGEVLSADFPVFALSDGDKATLKAERGSDGALRVIMRGEVYDGRNFVKSSLAGHVPEAKRKQDDLDLDIKIGAVAGHNGETLRGLNLKLSRRKGHIRSFAMNAKVGRDTPLIGDMRLRARDNHQVIYFETDDAGALFRFTDMYPRMYGGQLWVAMDPPTEDQTPQIGHLYISGFAVRGEPALNRVVATTPANPRGSVDFSEMHADFTRFPGKMAVRDGVVRGPLVGATIEGQIDYVRNEVHLRGTFVPLYGLNNMFGQIPIVGLFLGGGSNEGLLGITYEARGPPSSPRITVNPVSAIAPGLLRKFIPSPGTFDPKFTPPSR